MNKFFKRTMLGASIIAGLLIFTSCTRSFCNVNDSACLYNNYELTNRTTINQNAVNNNVVVPQASYFDYLDDQVDIVYTDVFVNNNTSVVENYVPSSYVESHKKFLDSTTTEEEKKGLVNVGTIKAIIKFSGENKDKNATLWANFDVWTQKYAQANATKAYAPTAAYISYYKTQIQNGVGSAVTCLTPNSGYYGINQDTYVEGKTWAQAFNEYGFLEGLLVYPIGWLIYSFTTAFGVNGAGQILAIFLVTLICRLIIVVLSSGTYSTQYKMQEIQPQLSMLQARYPNSQTNEHDKQQLAQAQMKLYKDNNIHPFRQILVMFVQFPLFICVWGALQGSAILTQGSVFNLQLSTNTLTAITSNSSETPFAIILFLLMAIGQFFSTMLPTWMQSYHKKQIVGDKVVKVEENPNQSMMKYMPIMMMVMVIFMGLNLPAAMGIYWFFGALISIAQTIFMEIYHSSRRNKKPKNKDKYTSYKKVDKKKHMKIR